MKKKEEIKEEVKCECKKVEKLSITFNSEDLNKVVEKINEIIESKCQ